MTFRVAARTLALTLLAKCLLTVGCAQSPVWEPGVTELESRTEVPIEFPARGIPGLVLGGGDNPTTASLAVLDTGSPVSFFTQRFVDANGLKVRSTSLQMKDFQGKTASTPKVARLPALRLGDATFRNFDVVVADLPAMKALSERLDAVLSPSLFREVLLTIDYPRRRLILERGALPEPNGRDVLPLRRSDSGHLLIPARLLGEDAWLVLDTGHTGEGLTLSRYRLIAMTWASTLVDGFAVQTFLGVARVRLGRMNGDMTIGQYTIRRPIIGISFDDDMEIIGADVLRHFVMTLDQKNGRIRLARATTAPIEIPPVRRLGFTFTDEQGTIQPTPGSEAQRAGLQAGDRVISINGIPTFRWGYLFFEHLESRGDQMIMRIERDGREITLRVPVTTVIP